MHACGQVPDVGRPRVSQHPAPLWGCRMFGGIGRPTSGPKVFKQARVLKQDLLCVHTRDLMCAHKRSLVCTREISCGDTSNLLWAYKKYRVENSMVCQAGQNHAPNIRRSLKSARGPNIRQVPDVGTQVPGGGCKAGSSLPTSGASLGVPDVGPDWAPNIRQNGVHA